MTYPTTYQDMERLLLPKPEPASSNPEPVDISDKHYVADEAEHHVADVANPEPPIPDFEAERDPEWVKSARAAMFSEMRLEDGEAEPE